MKIEKIIFIFSLFITNNNVNAQSINDSIFNNVLLIQKEDVIKNSDDYLLDVIIDFDFKKTPIIYNDTRLSIDSIASLLFKYKSFIVITPDWEYYDKIAEEAVNMGGCIEPTTTNIFYQRTYIENEWKTDSIRISGDQPKIVFKQPKKDVKFNDNIVFYHIENFDSTCCPKDPKWNVKQQLDQFIISFERENNITIGDIYKKITGKEGEHILYFTLSNLNIKQKLLFLQEVRFWTYPDQKLEHIKFSPQIFMPKTINKVGLKLISK